MKPYLKNMAFQQYACIIFIKFYSLIIPIKPCATLFLPKSRACSYTSPEPRLLFSNFIEVAFSLEKLQNGNAGWRQWCRGIRHLVQIELPNTLSIFVYSCSYLDKQMTVWVGSKLLLRLDVRKSRWSNIF